MFSLLTLQSRLILLVFASESGVSGAEADEQQGATAEGSGLIGVEAMAVGQEKALVVGGTAGAVIGFIADGSVFEETALGEGADGHQDEREGDDGFFHFAYFI